MVLLTINPYNTLPFVLQVRIERLLDCDYSGDICDEYVQKVSAVMEIREINSSPVRPKLKVISKTKKNFKLIRVPIHRSFIDASQLPVWEHPNR